MTPTTFLAWRQATNGDGAGRGTGMAPSEEYVRCRERNAYGAGRNRVWRWARNGVGTGQETGMAPGKERE